MTKCGTMFLRESEMAPVVSRWLRSEELRTKSEFVTPWGICDLVGVKFIRERVEHRLRLKQSKSIASITRAALLLHVPEVESAKSISIRRLITDFADVVPENVVVAEVERLIADRFVVSLRKGHLQKLNGWMPLQKRLVAVELKLSRIEEALQQARCNLGFAQESFVAFPLSVAKRIMKSRHNWREHFSTGIGLIGVQIRGCEVLIPAEAKSSSYDPAIQLYCVEKFWRTRSN